MNLGRFVLISITLFISIMIIITFYHGILFLFFPTSSGIGTMSSKFKSIGLFDSYNNTYDFDITFSTDNPDFFVGEKINVNVILDPEKNIDENFTLTSVYFSFVTTEGEHMPYQSGHQYGILMNRSPSWYSGNYFWLDYDTYLNFSGKYSCRFRLNFWNFSLGRIVDKYIIEGYLLNIEPSSVKAQLELAETQSELSNKNLGFAFIVITLTFLNILILCLNNFVRWSDKINYYRRFYKWRNGKNN